MGAYFIFGIEMNLVEIEDAIESVNLPMAMHSLYIAEDDLNDLLEDANYPLGDFDPDRYYRICRYTRVVHTIV